DEHAAVRPGFFARLLGTAKFRAWRVRDAELKRKLADAAARRQAAATTCDAAAKAMTDAENGLQAAQTDYADARTRADKGAQILNAWQAKLGKRMLDPSFAERRHEERHLLAPWFDDQIHRLRDDVFVAAMALHKAFANAAA